MRSKAKFLGHPLHQTLIVFPVGLLMTSLVFDLLALLSGSVAMLTVSYWLIFAGSLGGIVAAPFGVVDWLAIPSGTRAYKIGAVHGIGNVIVLVLFVGSWYLRPYPPLGPGFLAYLLSFSGGALLLTTAWLGGELVTRLGVGVDDDAHLDAPSSIGNGQEIIGPEAK
jgi:uncharacterized membrane protein